jgi:chromate transporter
MPGLEQGDGRAAPGRVWEVARLFLRLGFTAFGGPAAHVGMIEDEVVGRRKWMDRAHFMDLVSAVNFIPGPNSTELAIHVGYVRAGRAGLVAAGVCFIVPAVLIILPIAWAYVTYGAVPEARGLMTGVNAAVIAVVAAAVWRFGRGSLVDGFTVALACAAGAAALAAPRFASYHPDLVILVGAATAGALRRHRFGGITPLLLPLAGGDETFAASMGKMFLFFLKVGGTLFGSGYVLISYLQVGLVDQLGWLGPRQVLDAVAVGQMTPGPLLTTATFVGYLLGQEFGGGIGWAILGAVVATVGIFLPSFVFVLVLAPVLPRVRAHPTARGALDAMNAAVVALIAVAGWRLAAAAVHDWVTAAVFAAALVGLVWMKLNATWVVGLGAAVGLVTSLAT